MDADRRIAALILAAGESRRFGSPKQLALLEGRTMLEHVLDLARAAELAPIVAIVPGWLTRPRTFGDPALRWVRNPYPERGMSYSLRLGLAAVPDETTAAVILLGDQPRVMAESLAAVLAARGERPIVATEAGGVLAPPVLIERSHFELAEVLTGDAGLRDVLRQEPNLVRAVAVRAHATDVDMPRDLDRV